MVVRKFGVLSVGKIMGALYALLGFVLGIFAALFSLIGSAVGMMNSDSSTMFGSLFVGVGSIIFLPLVYGILGFIFGLISALLYNVVARFIGGIEIEVD